MPDSIFELTNLEILSLTNNKLIEISPKIGRLTQLKELSLMGNNLSTLPKEISNLVVLERLLLLGNKFMPEELERIHRLLPCTDLFIYLDSELNDYYNYPPCNKF